MRFNLLGSCEVSDSLYAIRSPSPKAWQVLALLVVRAGVVTPTEHLVEELWGTSPPRSAIATLQTYIHHLRRGLSPGDVPTATGQPRCLLVTQAGVYLLRLGPGDSVDLHEFERHTQRGRAQLAAHDTASAATSFRKGLELWRGNVLGGVRLGPHLYIQAVLLNEERRTALNSRIDADLQLGRHSELVAELRALVSAEQANEGLSMRLMRALSGAGRRADAMVEYDRLRCVLAAELGVGPSPASQQLCAAILSSVPMDDDPMSEPVHRSLRAMAGRSVWR